MEFKDGDRVHVRMLHGGRIDFYATLRIFDEFHFKLTDCSNTLFNNFKVYRPNTEKYRLNDCYYYTLVTEESKVLKWSDGSSAEGTPIMCDEEDSEEPVIQRTTDNVNHPDHYNYGEIEIIDFIEQVTQHYNSVVAYHIGNAIKYLARSPHKNGKEDIEKARWYIERAYQKWSD